MDNLNDDVRRIRRQLAARSLWAFAKTYLPGYITHAPSTAHQELYAQLEEMAVHRGKRLAVAAPRGFGKSMLATLNCVLYGICYGLEQFIVILSGTNSQAMQHLEAVRRELEENEKLRVDFPEVVGARPHPWTRSEIVTSNHVRVLALGTGQRIRGRKHGKDRPTLVIGDDLENAESTFSLESRERLKDWFTRSVLKVGAEATNFVLLGTLHHPYCLLAEYVDPTVHPEWIKRVLKTVLSWSSHPELEAKFSQIYNGREAWEGQRGPEAAKFFYEAHRQALEEGIKLLWEARWSFYDLLVEREEDPIGFSSERQNEPLDLRFCSFNLEEYSYWCDQFRTVEALLQALGDHVVFYAACDPALGLDATRGDYTAIVIIAKDTRDNSLYVIVADIQRYTPTQAINALFAYYQRYRFQWLAVETNQFQELMAQEIERRGRELGVTLPIKRIKNTGDKVGRIQSLQPALKSQRVKLCRAHRLLLEQLRFHPKARHDDGPDALEMAIRITEELPAVELTIVGGDSEPWWRDYERNLGWKIF